MVSLHPQYIHSGDKDQFVVLPHAEFLAPCELLEDLEDLQLIEEARKENAGQSGISLEQLKAELGLK